MSLAWINYDYNNGILNLKLKRGQRLVFKDNLRMVFKIYGYQGHRSHQKIVIFH
jgi:hypothetical protein